MRTTNLCAAALLLALTACGGGGGGDDEKDAAAMVCKDVTQTAGNVTQVEHLCCANGFETVSTGSVTQTSCKK